MFTLKYSNGNPANLTENDVRLIEEARNTYWRCLWVLEDLLRRAESKEAREEIGYMCYLACDGLQEL